ncbi:MAG: ribosome maturation factor RimP [Ruminococcaceae bacterium]|nr:ribosome maturation factor RimP [Oscillospiraceae bacterium]
MAKITDAVYEIAYPIAKENGCEIFDVEYKKEGTDYVLRVFIEKENVDEHISIDDCEKVSRKLSDELDKKDPIPNEYLLEVSSPGIDRPLRNNDDYEKYLGFDIDVGLYNKMNGQKVLTGELSSYGDDYIVIKTGKEEINIEIQKCAYIKLAIKF